MGIRCRARENTRQNIGNRCLHNGQTYDACRRRWLLVKAAYDNQAINKFIRPNFGGGLALQKLYILNVRELIPLKLNTEFGQWWNFNKVVFGLIDYVSLRCYVLPKVRFRKTRLRVQVFSSWRRQQFLILPLIDQLKPLLCHNRSRL